MPEILGTSKNNYPQWTILLGIGGTADGTNWYGDTDFSDLKITDKVNQIPIASVKFHNKTAVTLKDQNIRFYLDGKKKFSGVIRIADDERLSSKVSIEARGLADYPHNKVIETVIDIRNTKSSKILEDYLKYPGWSFDITNDNNTDYLINYRIEKGNLLMHINAIAVLNYWDWWCDGEDSETGLETRKVYLRDQRGKASPTVTFHLEQNAYGATLTENKEKVKNSIVVVGSSSAASNMSSTATGFWNMGDDETPAEFGYLIGSESILAKPVEVNDVVLVLEDSSRYEPSGQVYIGEVIFAYTANSGTALTLDIPSKTAHEPQSPVLIKSLFRAYIPSTFSGNKIWIGNELVQCGSIDNLGMHDLTRGMEYNGAATPIYPHLSGTSIYSGAHSPNEPHANSSLQVNGRYDMRSTAVGAVDRDGLDKFGSSVLRSMQADTTFGSHFIALDELQDLETGDYFYLQEYGSDVKTKHRCTGIVFSEDSAEIIFGLNEEWINQQFDDISKVEDTTYAKNDKSKDTPIIAVSKDGKSVQVSKDDGSGVYWVPIK